MLAYHNDPAVKQKYLDRVRAHRQADQLVQGFGYWDDHKGCAGRQIVGAVRRGSERLAKRVLKVLAECKPSQDQKVN